MGCTTKHTAYWETLISTVILARLGDDIAFKYPCFKNYFVASHLKEDKDLLDQIFADGNATEYFDEIDLMSGLHRRNSELIVKIGNELDAIAPSELTEQSLDSFDTVAGVSPSFALNLSKLRDLKKKKLTHDQIDDLMDAADREIQNPLRKGTISKALRKKLLVKSPQKHLVAFKGIPSHSTQLP